MKRMTREEALKYREAIEHTVQSLLDYEAVTVPKLFPWWRPGKTMNADERVYYDGDGLLYKVLQTHISQDDWTPDVAVGLFAKVLIPDPTIIPEWEQPSSTNPYMKGDKVTHNDNTWVSNIDNNVWEPGVYGWSVAEVE